MMTRQDWQTLVAAFAPQVRLSVRPTTGNPDQYQPSSIDWFLDRCVMVDHDDPGFSKSPVDRDTLVLNPEETRRLAPTSQAVYEGDRQSSGQWPMYAHIRNSVSPPSIEGQGWIDIQYWFFYPYNGGSGGPGFPIAEFDGEHEGDWEHVTVRVKDWRNLGGLGAANLQGVFYAAHTSAEGKWILESASASEQGAYAVTGGTHPIVYSAWHTHASYEYDGVISRTVSTKIFGSTVELAAVGNDFTSNDGIRWGPLAAAEIEISSIDEDVYRPDDERLEPSAWLVYEGRWGNLSGPPVGPAQKGSWRSDGMSGYYDQLDLLAPFGEDWDKDRGTTAIAFGLMKQVAARPEELAGIGRNKGKDFRFGLYRYAGSQLQPVATGGNWDKDIACTSLAFGVFGSESVVGVGKSAVKAPRFEVYRLAGSGLELVAYGGDHWGKDRSCTAISFGLCSQGPIAAVGRSAGDNSRFEIYKAGATQEAQLLFGGGSGWKSKQGCLGVALGEIGGRSLLAVAKSAPEGSPKGSRFELYEIQPGGLELVDEGGEHWGETRSCTAIALGVLGDRPALAVGRSKGDNSRFEVYGFTDGKLGLIASGGGSWSTKCGVTGIALGTLNGSGVLAVSVEGPNPGKVQIFQLEGDQLVPVDQTGDGWGSDRDATCVALGNLGGFPVIGYGRNPGNHDRGAILKWE